MASSYSTTTSEYTYYTNFNTVLIFAIICILISSAISIYRNAMIRARMDRTHNVQVVYYRPGGGAASVQPAYPPGWVVPNAPPPGPNEPPPPMPGSDPNRPPTSWGKPPPYAAVA